ncbi:MAG: 50S ribosomal protein L17 [Candidatus Pacebacteria bacterium]|nr:50S ribosomal protein L17 [Candidatus Paceibacterota bacterium]
MRHRQAGKKLNRDRDHRQALFKNLIKSLIKHEEIKTTESKAKVVRKIFEKLVTKTKTGTLHVRRLAHAFLQDKGSVNKLVDKIAPLFKQREGGYTRIIRLGKRRGDRAMLVRLELVSKPEKEPAKKSKEKKRKQPKKAEVEPKKK